MSSYDLTEAVEEAVQALRVAGLADADGCGYVLENVYADGAVHVALTAALPHLEKQIREQIAAEIEASIEATPNITDPLPWDWKQAGRNEGCKHAARIARTRKDSLT